MANKLKNGSLAGLSLQDCEKFKEVNGRSEELSSSSDDNEQGQIHDIIGHFGKYQLLIFIFKISIGLTSAFNNLSVTFFAPSAFISYSCANTTAISNNQLHETTNLTSINLLQDTHFNNANYSDLRLPAISLLLNDSNLKVTNFSSNTQITKSTSRSLFNEFLFSEERKRRHQAGFSTDSPKNLKKQCHFLSNSDNKNHSCTSYQYDKGIWISTIIDEWDLVCDRAWFISVTQSLYMSGFIVSFLVFGYISDRFGRWKSLLIGALIEVMSGFGCALANSVTTFMIFRFLLGLGNAGRSSSSYLIMIEWVGPKWRMHISTLGSLGWVIGYCSMPWITLYFLNFRHMQLFVCFYELIFVIWLLRLPESPRWLLTKKKFKEAHQVLLMAAKFNGLIVKKSPVSEMLNINENNKSKEISKPYTMELFNIKFKQLINTIHAKDFTKNENNLNVLDLFKWTNLRNYAMILYFVWAANSFIYYGIVLRVGEFGGSNLFVAFTIAGITEIPSIAFTILCMKFLPRKTTNLFLFITTGTLCIIELPFRYYQLHVLQQSTIMLAKLFNSCSFTCILYQTMELFPTSIRQTAYSSCCVAGRIGSILAPFIKELALVTNNFIPPMMYAALSFIAAFLITSLPETKGLDLPDTLLEAEQIKKEVSESEKEKPVGVNRNVSAIS